MKLKTITALFAIIGCANTAYADKTFGDGTLPDILVEYDVNEDGVIDEEERQAIIEARKAVREARRAEIDTNGDGEISEEEREAAREAIREAIEAKRSEKFAEIAGEDGLLTLEEFAALPNLADADPERVEAIFNRLDADNSGDVTFEEFTARLRKHRDRERERIRIRDRDRDHDGPKQPEAPVE